MKNIKFREEVTKFGHPAFDYKKEGTLRKRRENEHYYRETVDVVRPCVEVVVDGKLIGYARKDELEKNNETTLVKENGSCVLFTWITCSGNTPHLWGTEVSKKNGKWFFHPQDYRGYPTFCLWVCDEEYEPLWVVKESFDIAVNFYTMTNAVNRGDIRWTGLSHWLQLNPDFDITLEENKVKDDFKNKVIDIQFTR